MDICAVTREKEIVGTRGLFASPVGQVIAVFFTLFFGLSPAHAQMVGADRHAFLSKFFPACFKSSKQFWKAQNRDASDALVTAWCTCNGESFARNYTFGEIARAEQEAARGKPQSLTGIQIAASNYCQSHEGNWLRLVK